MKKILVVLVLCFLVVAISASAGTDATNVTFVALYPSVYTNGSVTTKTIAVEFEFPSAPGTNPRLQCSPDPYGEHWRNFVPGEVMNTRFILTNLPYRVIWQVNPDVIWTSQRYFRVLYTESEQ